MTRRLPLFGERPAVATGREGRASAAGPPILAVRPTLLVDASDADPMPFVASLVRGLGGSGWGGFVIATGGLSVGGPGLGDPQLSAMAADERQLEARLDEHPDKLAVIVGAGGRRVRPTLSVLVVRPGCVAPRAGDADLVVGAPGVGVAEALGRRLAREARGFTWGGARP